VDRSNLKRLTNTARTLKRLLKPSVATPRSKPSRELASANGSTPRRSRKSDSTTSSSRIRGALKQAIEDGTIQHNPLEAFQIKRVSKPGSSIDPFTPEEVALLAREHLGDLWTFWAWSGLRSGEIIGLQLRDIERDAGQIFVRRSIRVGREKSPKTASGTRTLALLPAARAALRSVVAQRNGMGEGHSAFVNPNTGERWHEDRGLARAFRKACEAAGVRYRYPYQLRHTFATWALSSGENPAWIARYMGHADTMMLFRVYGKWMPSLDPQAGSKMTERVGIKAA
jgi:integrase